jgi:hypothetical protein
MIKQQYFYHPCNDCWVMRIQSLRDSILLYIPQPNFYYLYYLASDKIIHEHITNMTYFRYFAAPRYQGKRCWTDLNGPGRTLVPQRTSGVPRNPQKISVYFTWSGLLGPWCGPYSQAYQEL